MPHFIVHVADRFLVWSTVVDAPITYGMTRDEIKEYHLEEYGRQGCERLDERLDLAVANGTSKRPKETALDAVSGNRAGPGETELSLEEIVRFYVTEQRDPQGGDDEDEGPSGDDDRADLT